MTIHERLLSTLADLPSSKEADDVSPAVEIKNANISVPAELRRRDLDTLERTIARYTCLGYEASLGLHAIPGRATIWQVVNPRDPNSDTFEFSIEKCITETGRSDWRIRVAKASGSDMAMEDIGEVRCSVLVFAIVKAEKLAANTKRPELPIKSPTTLTTRGNLRPALDQLIQSLLRAMGVQR
jgi:hypothetical protein